MLNTFNHLYLYRGDTIILRPYQKRTIEKCITALNKHGNTLAVLPTGAGKTVVFSEITKRIIGKDKRAMIVQGRDELTDQNAKTFDQMFPDTHISFFNAQRKSWRGQVVFSMIQTLSQDRHLDRMPPVDLLVYDEVHHAASNSYRKLTARAKELNSKTKIFGVTATPERADSKGLKDTFSNVADIINIGEMVQGGYLVPPRGMVIDIGTQGALRAVKKTASDYNMAEVEAIQNSIVLNKRIIEKWETEAVNRPTVAFCATIKHALDVRDSFQDAGYVSESISSNTPKKERRAILKSYDRGEIQILANPMLLTEGWDCQVCSCIMLLRISSHKSTMIQMIGRGLRKVDPRRYPGIIKTDCKVLDFGISLLNHGNLEADVNLRFDRQSDIEAAKKNCPMCNSELPIQAHVCPLCGYEFKVLPIDSDFNELEEFKLIEIDILNNSPFRWISIFPSEKVLITTGFGSWAAVVSKDGDNWFAIGNGQGKKTEVLTIANKIGAISSADDYMRANETSASSKKAAKWQNEPASLKQQQILFRMGYQENGFSKVEAACHLTFRFNQRKIEGLIQ